MAEENNINKSDNGDQSNDEFLSDNNRIEEVEEGPHFHGNEPDIGLGNMNLNNENTNAESKSARKEDVVVSFKHFLNNFESNRSNRTANSSSNSSDIRNILDRNNFAAASSSVSSSVSNSVSASASSVASSNTYHNPFSVADSNLAPPSLPDVSSDISSALPDFVQDHLAMEQHYFNRNHSAPNFPMNSNLPDFASYAPVCPSDDVDQLNNKTSPDSSSNLSSAASRNAPSSVERANRNALNGVFRLDNYPSNSDQAAVARTANVNPLDLPPSHSIPNECVNRQPCRPISRMPDFLADSHVYGYVSSRSIDSSATDPRDLCQLPQSSSNEQLRIENEILRKRVEDLRESLAEQTRRLAQAESLLSRTTKVVCPNCQRGDSSSVSSSTVEHYLRRSVPSGSKYFTVSPPSELTESVKDAIELAKQLINRLYDARSASRNLHIPDDVVASSKKPENDRSDDDSE